MKKLLGLIAFAALLLLSACGGSGETVCTLSYGERELITTVQTEDGYIITAELEERIDISDADDDEVERMLENEGGTIEGDYIVIIVTRDYTGENLSVDEFIANAENGGATCN